MNNVFAFWGRIAYTDKCTMSGYPVNHVFKEIGSGINNSRPRILALPKDQQATRSSLSTLNPRYKQRREHTYEAR